MLKVLTANTCKEQVNNDNERQNSKSSLLVIYKSVPLTVDPLSL